MNLIPSLFYMHAPHCYMYSIQIAQDTLSRVQVSPAVFAVALSARHWCGLACTHTGTSQQIQERAVEWMDDTGLVLSSWP